MTAHTIVYLILSALSVVAAHALATPVNETPPEQHETGKVEED